MQSRPQKTAALKNTIELLPAFEFYRTLFRHSDDAVLIVDLSGNITYASPSASAMLEYDNPEALYRAKALPLTPSEYHDDILSRIKQTFASGFHPPFTHEIFTRGRIRFKAESSISLLRDCSGIPAGFVIIARKLLPGEEKPCTPLKGPSHYKSITENISAPCILVDEGDTIFAANNEFAGLTAFSATDLQGRHLSELFNEKEFQQRVLNTHPEEENPASQPFRCQTTLRDKHGCVKPVIASVFCNNDIRRKIVSILDLATVSEKNSLLSDRVRERDTIFEAIGQPAVILDPSFTILDGNKKTAELLGIPIEKLRGQKCYTVFHGTKEAPKGCPLVSAVKSHHFSSNEMKIQMLNGYYLVSCTPVCDSFDNILKIIHIATDVSEWHNTAQALKLSEKRYKTMFENTGTAMCIVSQNGDICTCNHTFLQLTNLDQSDIDHVVNICNLLHTYGQTEKPDPQQKPRKRRFPYAANIEAVLETPHNGTRYLFATTSKIPNTKQFIVSLTDITPLREAEQKIAAQLNEKELLLKEIHHRVKNNLQVISSLLRLQSRRLPEKEIRDVFTDSQARIHSMALVHEELYKSDDLSSIDFKVYVTNLIHYLFRSMNVAPGTTDIQILADNIRLNIDQIITCGLIVNELLTNSLKYAFPPSFTGPRILRLEFSLEKDSMYRLMLSDNGVGIPEHINIDNSDSLGLRLINMLACDQLEGSMHATLKNGTSFTIQFPK